MQPTPHGFLFAQFRDRRSLTTIAIATIVIIGGGTALTIWRSQSAATPDPNLVIAPPEVKTITALGRLEPQGEIIKLSAPTANNGNRVEKLLVKQGDQVRAGQVVAVLDNYDRLQAALEQAQVDVRVAEAKLAITLAGAKQGEIDAQIAEIDRLDNQRSGDVAVQSASLGRLEAELQNAETEYNRYQSLFQDGAVSASQRDSKRLALETTRKSLQEAQATLSRTQSTRPAELTQARSSLNRIAEVRPVDVQADQVAVDRAIALVKQAQAELDRASVRSPVAGEILYVHTRSGEVVSSNGIVEIGQTRQMNVVAEIYQSDINKVQVGQKVRVTSDAIAGELTGEVELVGSQVRRQALVNTDPSTNIDSRIVEVRIALDAASSEKAAKFTNLQVTVVIAK
jgi:HlyD family secretion protein